jgi:hypothetical protein
MSAAGGVRDCLIDDALIVATKYVHMCWEAYAFETFRLNHSFFLGGAFLSPEGFVAACKSRVCGNDCVGDSNKLMEAMAEEVERFNSDHKTMTLLRPIFFFKPSNDREPVHQAVIWNLRSDVSILIEMFNNRPTIVRTGRMNVGKRGKEKKFLYTILNDSHFEIQLEGTVTTQDNTRRNLKTLPGTFDALKFITYKNVASDGDRIYWCRWIHKNKKKNKKVIWKVEENLGADFSTVMQLHNAPTEVEVRSWNVMYDKIQSGMGHAQKGYLLYAEGALESPMKRQNVMNGNNNNNNN